MIPHKNPAIRIIRSLPCSLTSFIYNVQPSPIFLSACAITRFLHGSNESCRWSSVAISAVVSRHLREVLKKISAKQVSPQFSFLFLREVSPFFRSFLPPPPLFPFPSVSLSLRGGRKRATENAREVGRKKAARRDDRGRAGGYNFISRHETNERALRDAPVGRQICSSLLLLPVFEIT